MQYDNVVYLGERSELQAQAKEYAVLIRCIGPDDVQYKVFGDLREEERRDLANAFALLASAIAPRKKK